MDGNSNTHFQSGSAVGSCTMTNGRRNQPWWRVDLGQDELVSEVYVVNRLNSDCVCGNRLDNFEIRVGKVTLDVIYEKRMTEFHHISKQR